MIILYCRVGSIIMYIEVPKYPNESMCTVIFPEQYNPVPIQAGALQIPLLTKLTELQKPCSHVAW